MECADHQRRRKPLSTRTSIFRCVVSLVVVLSSQFALLLVPLFVSPSSSLLSQLFFAAVILLFIAGLAKGCKRLLNVRASPPAMVLFHVVFLWAVYFAAIRKAVSTLEDVTFNGGTMLLIVGISGILSSDPGFTRNNYSSWDHKVIDDSISKNDSSLGTSFEETPFSTRRVRYCKICKAWVAGFDHHCPAFGNCIGKKNRRLFMALLVGFIMLETLYSICSYQYFGTSQAVKIFGSQSNIYENLAATTMLFSLLQIFWQVLFLAWHVYCVCFNITTDEWTNWKRYPEFHLNGRQEPDDPSTELRLANPFDKGILCNLKEFVLAQGD